MTPEAWRQLEDLYQAARALPPSQRSALLERADPKLRAMVASLLAGEGAREDDAFLDRPAWEGRLSLLDTKTIMGVGTQLGPYRIDGPIGAGGMGQVFRATDTRLGRAVAIKISEERFSDRFEREARAISSLNHPHICTLHDVGPNYLVMELVEGETLAARIKRGPLPLEQTIRYGAQIADALAAAHAKGIIHRDLKPANIMIAKAGVKVLDFGLARGEYDETLTAARAVMGTPAYMAPEQREGKPCDARTDIYALGLVLLEMTTGKRAEGSRPLPIGGVPGKLSCLLERLLAEDPADRWQSASDVQHVLAWIAASPVSGQSTGTRRTRFRWMAATALLLITGLVLGWTAGRLRSPAGEARPMHLAVTPPPGTIMRPVPAISPDGRMLAIPTHSAQGDKLWLRPLNSRDAKELPGTEGAASPFWSPDGRWIGFFAAGKLKKVSIDGGPPTVICDVGTGVGGTWNQDGAILFASVNDGPLLRVQASGGQPVPITTVDTVHQENSHRWPLFLPDGKRFLFFVRSANRSGGPGTQGTYIASLDRPGEKNLLVPSAVNAVYAPDPAGPTGHLLWVQEGNLMAQALDPGTGRLSGEARSLAGTVSFSLTRADVSAARNGTLVYLEPAIHQRQLTWVDRQGKPLGTIGPPDLLQGIRISPDGSRIAVAGGSLSVDIALVEVNRGVATPFTKGFGGVWSPDGSRVAHTWDVSGAPNLYAKAANGAGEEARLVHSKGSQMVYDWSADGRFLLYSEAINDPLAPAGPHLWILPLNGAQPTPLLNTSFRETRGQFSPDVKWIAYTSDEPGHPEVFVQSFPPGRGKWQISNRGGDYARWRRDGKELFYIAADGMLTSVAVLPGPVAPEFGAPVSLFRISVPDPPVVGAQPFDIAPDGRILVLTPAGEQADPALAVVLNWQAPSVP